MKIVFMGTPEYARTILEGIAEAGHEITAVYTQPDRPKGRSGQPVPSPVKEYAVEKGYIVMQPERIKRPEEVEKLKEFPADVFVVAAYGQILSEEILNMPLKGCINAHGSLLPKLRGAAPIQRAIAEGEKETGITVIRMDRGIDTGDMLSKASVEITDTDDEASMYEKLAIVAREEILKALEAIENNTAVYVPQNPDEATYAPMLTKEEGLLDFSMSAHLIDCKVRGFKEWPTAYTFVNGKSLKIFGAKEISEDTGLELPSEAGVFVVTKKKIYVTCGEGLLELTEVQPEGKKRMGAMDFARGQHIETGMKIGS